MSSGGPEDAGAALDIHRLLRTMVEQGASDLHLTVDAPPSLRVNGSLLPLRTPPLKPDEVQALAYSVLNERQRKKFEETHEVDLSFQWKRSSRFRANFFMQRGKVAGAIRMIPFETQPISALGL
ncbi:MAG: type IV pili twitching motility protein PilT, partial [Myxococcota bacterium]|nr:type IV pili twitching motility protein PilT [Myxococcota bacterium]